MIEEALLWLTARATHEARRSGGLIESVGYGTRARRSASQWHSHWAHCQRHLLSWLDELVRRQAGRIPSLAILGAGTLRDIPIQDLLERVDQLICIDHVQLLPTRLTLLRYANRVRWHTLDARSTETRAVLQGVFAVYSANIASQLDLRDPERAALLQEEHLRLLQRARAWLLITDVIQRPRANEPTVLLPTTRLQDLLGPPQEHWEWALDTTQGETNTVGVWMEPS